MQLLDNPQTHEAIDNMAAPRTNRPGGPNPTMDFLVDFMRNNPSAAYADAAAAAKSARKSIYPIMWGRAQVMLGRVKQKPRGQGKMALATRAAARESATTTLSQDSATTPPVKRGPGRPPKARVATSSMNEISVPVEPADVNQVSSLVAALNDGGRAMLRYDGGGWEFTVA